MAMHQAREQNSTKRNTSAESSPRQRLGKSASSIHYLHHAVGNQAVGNLLRSGRIQTKLRIGRPNDKYELEADRVAKQVMSMSEAPVAGMTTGALIVQRRCEICAASGGICPSCTEKEEKGFLQAKEQPGFTPEVTLEAAAGIQNLQGKGRPLPPSMRTFFEPRFGHDFSQVRIHTDARAVRSAQALSARAFTIGHDIVFGTGQFTPGTVDGKRLLAHELTHIVQQNALPATTANTPANSLVRRKIAAPIIQRAIYEGHDHGGRYVIDDQACTLTYHQSWYFTFQTNQTPAQRQQYMESAQRQIQDVWSGKFPLIPDGESCPCHPNGISVTVVMHPHERQRQGRGFSIVVTSSEQRGFTNPPGRRIDLGTVHERPFPTTTGGLTQERVAHEFGHAIGLPDEYTGWARFFNIAGSQDDPSIMHSGDEVRPRHYQPFADMVNLEIGAGCTYSPAGERQPAFENPVNLFTGVPFTFLPQNADFVIGVNFDRRISNTTMLGLFSPTVGATMIWNPEDQSVLAGPTAGLRLNQLARPLFFNLRSGVLFDPGNPESALNLNIPLSIGLGIQEEGFQVGVNYTGIANILGSGNWTHLVGVGLQVDLPWERRRRRR